MNLTLRVSPALRPYLVEYLEAHKVPPPEAPDDSGDVNTWEGLNSAQRCRIADVVVDFAQRWCLFGADPAPAYNDGTTAELTLRIVGTLEGDGLRRPEHYGAGGAPSPGKPFVGPGWLDVDGLCADLNWYTRAMREACLPGDLAVIDAACAGLDNCYSGE